MDIKVQVLKLCSRCYFPKVASLVLVVLIIFQFSQMFETSIFKDDLLNYKESIIKHGNHNSSFRETSGIHIRKTENKTIQLLLNRGNIEPASEHVSTDTKIILWYQKTRYHPKLAKLHPLRGCPNVRCHVTTNRYFYNQSDALVFAAQILEQNPPLKRPNQVWILHNHESPQWVNRYTKLYKPSWRSKFNWTLDYREDSDIEDPYGFIKLKDGEFQKRHNPLAKNYTDILHGKYSNNNASVAWMVSNCNTPSLRSKYVTKLRKYLNVDIFGGCGTHKCPRSRDEACLEHLSKKYKFYLAFENALCKDYISEKFFRFFKSDMVVIVRGGGNYSRVAPAGTYINTADFLSVKHLADHINELNGNDDMYLSILKEKDKYEVLMEDWPIVNNGKITYMTYHYDAMPMCEVCERLWNVNKYRKHYKDIRKWFDKGLCRIPNDLK